MSTCSVRAAYAAGAVRQRGGAGVEHLPLVAVTQGAALGGAPAARRQAGR